MFIVYIYNKVYSLLPRTTPATRLAVLVYHAVDAPVAHGLAVVYVLRGKRAIAAKNQLNG